MDTLNICCQVCHRQPGDRLPFNCTACARNIFYEPRVELAQTLLVKEAIGKEVEQAVVTGNAAILSKSSRNKASDVANDAALRVALDRALSEKTKSKDKSRDIMTEMVAMQKEMDEMRDYIAKEKAALPPRRTAYKIATEELAQQESLLLNMPKQISDIES